MLKLIIMFGCLLVGSSTPVLADSTPTTSKGTLSYISRSSTKVANNKTLVVNINTASAQQLANILTGIGLKKARALVAWRHKFGPFKHIYQLTEVKGIGEKTVEKNKDKIRLK